MFDEPEDTGNVELLDNLPQTPAPQSPRGSSRLPCRNSVEFKGISTPDPIDVDFAIFHGPFGTYTMQLQYKALTFFLDDMVIDNDGSDSVSSSAEEGSVSNNPSVARSFSGMLFALDFYPLRADDAMQVTAMQAVGQVLIQGHIHKPISQRLVL
jgi:hypothetical protein